MSSFLLYSACFGFILGIFTRSFVALHVPEIFFLFLVGIAVALAAHRKRASSGYLLLLAGSVFLILFSLGALRMELSISHEGNSHLESGLNTKVSLEGIVVRENDMRESTQHLYVKTSGGLLLVTASRYADVSYGDRISFTGTLRAPKKFQTDQGRTFNYEGYLKAKGVAYTVDFATVRVLEKNQGNKVIALLLASKHTFMSKLEDVVPEPEASLGEGLLLGAQQGLGRDLEDAFRTTGIVHIIVLSGYNIMLVVAFFMYLLTLFFPLRLRVGFGVLAIVLFACMVGLSATVVRASIMAVLFLVAKATGRTYAVLRALILTGVVMLCINPYLLAYDPGFELSFMATLGLILVAPHMEKHLGFMPTKLGLREFLTATLSTQIFVTPLLLYLVGQFSVVAIVVNMLVLPMVPVAMLLTFIAGMLSSVTEAVALPFAYGAHLSLAYILGIASAFAKLPFAALRVPAFPFYVVVLCYIPMALALVHWHKPKGKSKTTIDTKALSSWTIVNEESLTQKPGEERSSSPGSVPFFFR